MDTTLWDKIAGNWQQLKGHVQREWGEFTDDEIDQIEGRRDVLMGKVRERYGVSDTEAERQVNAWVEKLDLD